MARRCVVGRVANISHRPVAPTVYCVAGQGPFVHVASILAHKMWKLPWFSHAARVGRATRNQNLAAAVAAGVTAVFGAPVGGVLFSIEVTATYYLVRYASAAGCGCAGVARPCVVSCVRIQQLVASVHLLDILCCCV